MKTQAKVSKISEVFQPDLYHHSIRLLNDDVHTWAIDVTSHILNKTPLNRSELGLFCAISSYSTQLLEFPSDLPLNAGLLAEPGMLGIVIANYLEISGLCMHFAGGTVAGVQAVGEAFQAVKDGRVDQAISVGVSPQYLGQEEGVGEGASMVLLEEFENARSRGANVFAEVLDYWTGYGNKEKFCANLKEEVDLSIGNLAYGGLNANFTDFSGNLKAAQGAFNSAIGSLCVKQNLLPYDITGEHVLKKGDYNRVAVLEEEGKNCAGLLLGKVNQQWCYRFLVKYGDIYKTQMGCCASRRYSDEEIYLRVIEHEIPLSKQPCEQFMKYMLKNCQITTATQQQLAYTFNELNIDFDFNNTNHTQLLDYFKINDNQYNTVLLISLNLLLCNCNIRHKARVLFNTYNFDASEEISTTEAIQMLDDIVEISYVIIPKYATALAKENKEKMEKYSKFLLSQVGPMRRYMMKKLRRGRDQVEIFYEEMVHVLHQDGVSSLLKASSLRLLLSEGNFQMKWN